MNDDRGIPYLEDLPSVIIGVQRFMSGLQFATPALNFNIGESAPPSENDREGLIAYDNGSGWNQDGDGVKMYRFHDGTSYLPITQIVNGESVLSSVFTITAADGTFATTGLTITLPSAGTWKISGLARAGIEITGATVGWIAVRLYNQTDSAVISNSESLCLAVPSSLALQVTAPIDALVTVTASKVIRLEACRNQTGGGTWVACNIMSDVYGRTKLMYQRYR